ncbi:MAG: YezD family protein [Pseudomonadota bacterium]
MGVKQESKSSINEAIIRNITEQVEKIKYGTILIKVHESKIVQMEYTEKTRYEDMWVGEKGGGI